MTARIGAAAVLLVVTGRETSIVVVTDLNGKPPTASPRSWPTTTHGE